MSWASRYVFELQNGNAVSFRPTGNSMSGRVSSGQLVTCVPVKLEDVVKDDVVLCRVHGRDYLHLVKATGKAGLLIGNNHGGTNGWTRAVYGRMVEER